MYGVSLVRVQGLGLRDTSLHLLDQLYLATWRCMYVCMYIHTHTSIYINIHTCVYMCVYIHTYIHTYRYTNIHTYVCTYINTYLYTSRMIGLTKKKSCETYHFCFQSAKNKSLQKTQVYFPVNYLFVKKTNQNDRTHKFFTTATNAR